MRAAQAASLARFPESEKHEMEAAMTTIMQCKFCASPFQSYGGRICPNCLEQIELDLSAISDYMYENPGEYDIDRLCDETGVKKKVVMHLIDEKRLIFRTAEGYDARLFSCSVCHRAISEGTICESCRDSL